MTTANLSYGSLELALEPRMMFDAAAAATAAEVAADAQADAIRQFQRILPLATSPWIKTAIRVLRSISSAMSRLSRLLTVRLTTR